MSHPCAIRGCHTPAGDPHLMCRRHWFMVPANIRKQIFEAWRDGRRAEYVDLVNQAREAVRITLEAARNIMGDA